MIKVKKICLVQNKIRGCNLNKYQSICYYNNYQLRIKWGAGEIPYNNIDPNKQSMYNQLFTVCPQNFIYVPQYMVPELTYPTFYSQLPPTYQNQYYLSSQQYLTYPTDWIQPELRSYPSETDQKTEDSEETLSKSEQKVNLKKFSIFKYPKKNAESNIINQIFSFLSLRVKSEPILEKVLQNNQQKIQNFYEVLKQLKKRNKKYINRCYIKDLALFENDHIGHRIIQEITAKGSRNAITVEEFKKGLRILVNFYLKSKCISTVITSRKLDKETMKEHLHRKREVFDYFSTQMEILRNAQQ